MLKDEGSIMTQLDKVNSDPTANPAGYEPPKHDNEQVDGHNAVKESDKILKTDWRKYLSLPDKYSGYRDKFNNMLTPGLI